MSRTVGEDVTNKVLEPEIVFWKRFCLLETDQSIPVNRCQSLACNRHGTCNSGQEQSKSAPPQGQIAMDVLTQI